MKVYEKKSFPRNPVEFDTMNKAGKLSFNNAAQRSLVWKNTEKDNRKSLLIDSMIRGLPINNMYCNCIFTNPKDKVYDFIDGKQRTNTIIEFLNNQFKLINIPLFNLDEDGDDEGSENLVDLNGKSFSELPEWAQSAFKSYSVSVHYYENMSQDDVDDMIARINNGKSFTGIELTRLSAMSIEKIKGLGTHPIFSAAFKEKAISGYINEDVVIKAWAVLYQDRPSFETKELRSMIKTSDITDEQADAIKTAFTRIMDIYKVLSGREDKDALKAAKRLVTRTHLISIVPTILKAISDGVGTDILCAWVEYFFSGKKKATIDAEYNKAAEAGSGKADNVAKRLKIIGNSYNTYIKAITDEFKLQNTIKTEDTIKPEPEVIIETANVSEDQSSDEAWEDPEALHKEPEHEFNPNIYKDEFAEFNGIETDEDIDIDAILDEKDKEDVKAEETEQHAVCAA